MMNFRKGTLKRTALGVAASAVLIASLASCAPQDETSPSPTTTQSVPPTTVTEISDQPGSVEGFEGAREDLTVNTCARDGDVWLADGTITNPLDETRNYRLYVAAMDGDDTRGLIQVDVPGIEAGATTGWEARFPLDDDALTCVLRVERFADPAPAE